MNTFQDLEHALLAGVVLGSLRGKGVEADVMLDNVGDTTPYLRLKFNDNVEAVIMVLPSE